jgi:hypothetical protein
VSADGAAVLVLVPSGSGPLFAGTRRVEQRASTAAVDSRLPLRLEKGERRGYHPRSLLQIVRRESRLEPRVDFCFGGAGRLLGDRRMASTAASGASAMSS